MSVGWWASSNLSDAPFKDSCGIIHKSHGCCLFGWAARSHEGFPVQGPHFTDGKSKALKDLVKVKMKSLSHVRLFATPWTVAYQAPLSMGFSRQKYWSGLPFPFPEDLPNPGNWTLVTHIVKETESRSVVSDSLWHPGLYGPWTSPGQNTGVGSLSLLQGIFPTQGSDQGFLHSRQILNQLSHQGSPRILEWVAYSLSSGSFLPKNWTRVSYIAGKFFTNWAIREAHIVSRCFIVWAIREDQVTCA